MAKRKTKIAAEFDPFEVAVGHSYWRQRKQGPHKTRKGEKKKRAARNRVGLHEVE